MEITSDVSSCTPDTPPSRPPNHVVIEQLRHREQPLGTLDTVDVSQQTTVIGSESSETGKLLENFDWLLCFRENVNFFEKKLDVYVIIKVGILFRKYDRRTEINF
ncbi:hypothetical protein NPIL_575791 [Nephila pilipes]|uniref:Uncharacterized protein n=1 Tax=Nephila pilipes TaxID=299642 RepID=A0A8X6UD48_NEPPI|nr:hypothetical protein NPIL_575791 [Nephila pilipes]